MKKYKITIIQKKYYEMILTNNISTIYYNIINKSLYKINSIKECIICIDCFSKVDNCYYIF